MSTSPSPSPNKSGTDITQGSSCHRFNGRIFCVKLFCFVFVIIAWIIVILPYTSLVRYFLSPEVNATGTVNTQTQRIDSICEVINNSSLGFIGNRSVNVNLHCEYPYTSNGSLCVPICGFWYPAENVYRIMARVSGSVAASLSLICSILGIVTWIIIGKKLFEFPQVIPFYLFICASIQAICILIGQIQYEKFYCSHEDLFKSRMDTTPQCYIQGGIYHYVSYVFLLWYLSYVISVLLIIAFPFRLRNVDTANWKPHLVLFLISTGVPLLILIIYWAVDPRRYVIVNEPLVCTPDTTAVVIMFVFPLSLTVGLSLTSVLIIISQLIINQLRMKDQSLSTMNKKQTQFIIRTLGVIICFTAISLFLIMDFGIRASFTKPFSSYMELYLACATRYGSNTSCCSQNYTQYYNPELSIISNFFFSIWGVVALSTLAVKEARKLWINVLGKCYRCMCRRPTKSQDSQPEDSYVTPKRRLTELIFLKSIDEKKSDEK